jgi:hypothetical protein
MPQGLFACNGDKEATLALFLIRGLNKPLRTTSFQVAAHTAMDVNLNGL